VLRGLEPRTEPRHAYGEFQAGKNEPVMISV